MFSSQVVVGINLLYFFSEKASCSFQTQEAFSIPPQYFEVKNNPSKTV
ncbi:MAG: hypothetical protein HC817_02220 [Saprospiraceae bacterium]|nr:hypothetical protein [Saprospiraceae bacterium]